MTDEQVQRFRLMRLFAVSRLPKQHFYVRADRAAPIWVDPRDENDDNDAKNREEDDDDTDDEDEEDEEEEGTVAGAAVSNNMVDEVSTPLTDSESSSSSSSLSTAEKTLVYAKRPKLVIVRMRSGKLLYRICPLNRFPLLPQISPFPLPDIYRPRYGHIPRSVPRLPRSLYRTSNAGYGACLAIGYWNHFQVRHSRGHRRGQRYAV